ncbi:hypothetical protein [Sulfuracidifex metallicus]|uniref:hypothetical protein n=1 Tax=Sulfuracidifex metallicus TaxID=47303 RepID=UPI002273AF8A|nr:hypothetical protein [Sulfuracidifex metallicus]MCY0850110.1 hypothetical protein [Sulfuracidifex metallicus]
MTDFQDVLNFSIMKKRLAQFEDELKLNRESPKSLKAVVREFVEFTRTIYGEVTDLSFRELLTKQLKVAKRILLTINMRWIILFVYRRILTNLVNSLVSLINAVINQMKL